MLKHWNTSLAGILGLVAMIITNAVVPALNSGQKGANLVIGIVVAALGILAKDQNKT